MSSTLTTEQHMTLAEIDLGDNVRDLDLDHVDALAGSIAVIGLLTPLTVRAVGERFELVAGFHRHAACTKLGLDSVPVTLRDTDGSSADRAVENVVRKELSPLEEARAVRAMLDEGYTPEGTASVLGWSRKLVSARVKILELPNSAQQLIGTRAIPVGAVDELLRVNAIAPALVEALAQTVTDGELDGSQVVRDLGWALGRAMRHTESETFAAYLNQVDPRTIEQLRLGKNATAALGEAEKLHKQLDSYAYGPPAIRFVEADVDQARAAGVLIELERAAPIICDRGLYRELCKQAIHRTVEELQERKANRASEQAELRASGQQRERTPREQLDTEHRAALRDLAVRAAAVNLDLGAGLLTGLTVVDPQDVDVAKFFALCGYPHSANYEEGATMSTRSLVAPPLVE